jgi:hypothetical protein
MGFMAADGGEREDEDPNFVWSVGNRARRKGRTPGGVLAIVFSQ